MRRRKYIFGAVAFVLLLNMLLLNGCSNAGSTPGNVGESYGTDMEGSSGGSSMGMSATEPSGVPVWSELEQIGSMELQYATQFQVDFYEGGYSLITIGETDRYLLLPQKSSMGVTNSGTDQSQELVPLGLDANIAVIHSTANIYLAASATMDLFRELGALDQVAMTGTKAKDWTIESVRTLVEDGTISYAGKYSAPDYEMILTRNCDLAVESTMIYHTPEVREKLENLGIPVIVDRSSYEEEPLGRVEWIKLYGLLTGHEADSEAFMSDCDKRMKAVEVKVAEELDAADAVRKSVAFFYISSNGYANVRKPGDYVTKLIEQAGGSYAFFDVMPDEENALSTMNMEMESFFQYASNADILIYNSTVDVQLGSLEQVVQKHELFGTCDAVQNGQVWCTKHNMYQETTGIVRMLEEFHMIISGEADATTQMSYFVYLQ